MAVLTSRMAAAVDYLVSNATTTDTDVVDGPLSDADHTALTASKRLYVGASEVNGEDETVAVDGEQAFRTLGARLRDEHFSVHCVAEGWNGDDDMQAARNAAVAVLADVETLIRPTAALPNAHTLGGAVMWAGIGTQQMVQDRNETGAYCRVVFNVDCRANLNQP